MSFFEKPSHASLCSKFRPNYSQELVDLLLGYLQRFGASQDLLLDVACGTGQSTFLLKDHFSQCMGVDISEAQIKEAQKASRSLEKNNVIFLVGKAEELPVEANTVDFVTIATAWHWLADPEQFYSECKRVLKPKGCLAVYNYGFFWLADEKANVPLTKFIQETLRDHWSEHLRHAQNNYDEVVLPFVHAERRDFVMVQQLSLMKFIGFLSCLSFYQKFSEAHPDNKALKELEVTLSNILTKNSTVSIDEVTLDVRFPMTVFLGQNI